MAEQRAPVPRVATVGLPTPLVLGPKAKDDWKRWELDWKDYATINSLDARPDDMQVALFRTALGAEGKALLRNQPVPTDPDTNAPMDATKLKTLIAMMKNAVIGEVNETYETYIFRTRLQNSGETVDEFVTALRELIKTCGLCNHDSMKEKFLKDQVIFGIKDNGLREKLLQERGLTLSKCVDMCRIAESASFQSKAMSGSYEVNQIRKKPGRKPRQAREPPQSQENRNLQRKECRFCGRAHDMIRSKCPAYGRKCAKCNGDNHFAVKCTKKGINLIGSQEPGDTGSGSETEADVGSLTHGVAAVTSPLHTAKMRIQGRNLKFLLDSGASLSLLSAHDVDITRLPPLKNVKTLKMWNGSTQRSLGSTAVRVYNPKTKTSHEVEFDIVSEKLTPILGCIAAQDMGLVTMETQNYERVAHVTKGLKTKEAYLKEYSDVFSKSVGQLDGTVTLQVNDSAKPAVLPARRVPIAMQSAVKDELQRLVKLKIITPVSEPTDWVSQMVTVRKKDKSLRVCIDPTPLNAALKRERYQLPTFDDILPDLANAKVFSKLDLRSGYWHCVLDESSSKLTTFQSPLGSRYRWVRLPFGLSVSSEIFQRKLQEAMEGLEGVHIIADDVIVGGVGSDLCGATCNHDDRLVTFLERCRQKGIVLNASKFELRKSQIKLAGFVVGVDGTRPDPDRVKAITDMPAPTDVQSARRFLGVINFLAKFIPHMTTIVKPIQALLGKDIVWSWGPEHDRAVAKVKALISAAPVLSHFDASKPLIVQCDASRDGLGAVLLQNDHPLTYASRSLTQAECNYAQIEKELLSVMFALEKFHIYTYGRQVTVQNDHKPLVSIQNKPISKAPMRLQRMLMRLQKYDYKIMYTPGKDLHLADALSRAYLPTYEPGVTFDSIHSVVVHDLTEHETAELKRSTDSDVQLRELRDVIQRGWPDEKKDCPPTLVPYWDFRGDLVLCDGLIIKNQAILIPTELRPKYTKSIHQGHQGYDSCIRRVKDAIFWPGWKSEVRSTIEKCEICAKTGPLQQQKESLQQPETPDKAWTFVSADIMTLDGKDFLVTADSLSAFIEVDRLRTLTSREVILKLRMHFARYGVPRVLVTDNARQFTAKEFSDFATGWRFEHRTSSPHYPRSNGQAEAAVKTIKGIMKKAILDNTDVYKAILDYRNTPRVSTGLAPAEVMFQRRTRTATIPAVCPPTAKETEAKKAKQHHKRRIKQHYDKSAHDLTPMRIGSTVWFIEWQGQRKYWSKGRITDVSGTRSYIIRRQSDGATFRRNRIHIKPDRTSIGSEYDDDDSEMEEDRIDGTRRNTPPARSQSGYGFVPPQRTMSGRPVKPVVKY